VLGRLPASDVTGIRYALARVARCGHWKGFAPRTGAPTAVDRTTRSPGARAGPTGGDDVLSLLLGAATRSGRRMTDRELRDELVTLLDRRPRDDGRRGLAWASSCSVRHPPAMAASPMRREPGEHERSAGAAHATRRLRLRSARRHDGALACDSRSSVPATNAAGVRLIPGIRLVNRHPPAPP